MTEATRISIEGLRQDKIARAKRALISLISNAEGSLSDLEHEVTPAIGRILSYYASKAERTCEAIALLDDVQEIVDHEDPDRVKTLALASRELRDIDRWSFPHDDDCPRCGRRQWGLGPNVVDPMHPTDKEQATCGACGYEVKA